MSFKTTDGRECHIYHVNSDYYYGMIMSDQTIEYYIFDKEGNEIDGHDVKLMI